MRVDRLLADVRREAGLSQAKLAVRAGTSQSAIARYERAVCVPSIATLERLLRACGRSLSLAVATEASRPRRRTALGPRGSLVRRYRRQLLEVARRHGARNVRVFGSVARRRDTAGSDVDLLVDLEPDRTLLDLIGLQQDAADIVGFPVDVAVPEILKPGVRERVLREAVPL